MELNSERITELTLKYLKGELSAEERAELDVWLSDPYNRERFEERVKVENMLEGVMRWSMAEDAVRDMEWSPAPEAGVAKIIPLGEPTGRGKRRGRWIAAAAVALVLGGSAVLWMESKDMEPKKPAIAVAVPALQPGSNKAVLTLADGKTVNLDDASKGTVALQGSAKAVKEENGEVAYHNNGTAEVVENSIATPRGGHYRVVLADGSKIWLNAASRIQFPTAFTGKDREITVEGEAYLEVATDKAHPFVVNAGGMKVQVLGTAFDIMAYKDEQTVRASLVTGAVDVSIGVDKVALKPGREARLSEAGKLSVGNCDVNQVVAWKNGFLDFRGADISTVMRAVSRWWDVDVQFSGAVSQERFTGQLNKSLTGQEALQILTASGYHFDINGKTIIVLP